jgi:Txe/YoeB family toxin of Txe-Axe toxin-antitoxin module
VQRAVSVNFPRQNLDSTLVFLKTGHKTMLYIREVVKQAIETGYLTLEAEEKLRRMLSQKYSEEDLDAFIRLQQAAMTGQVKQQSRESFIY